MCALEREPGHACGGVPAAAVMRAARALGASGGGVRQYGDSGRRLRATSSSVVGYASAVWTTGAMTTGWSADERAAAAGAGAPGAGGRGTTGAGAWPLRPRRLRPDAPARLSRFRAAGDLRGCVGQVEPAAPCRRRRALRRRRGVAGSAIHAGHRPGAGAAFTSSCRCSVPLTPLCRPLEGSSRAGTAWSSPRRAGRGLLLPQVATEWGWTARRIPPADLPEGWRWPPTPGATGHSSSRLKPRSSGRPDS